MVILNEFQLYYDLLWWSNFASYAFSYALSHLENEPHTYVCSHTRAQSSKEKKEEKGKIKEEIRCIYIQILETITDPPFVSEAFSDNSVSGPKLTMHAG